MLLALMQAGATVDHAFVYRAPDNLSTVSVVGSFNNWNKDATEMKVGPDGRTWTVRLMVPVGQIEYKFVVNGSDYVLDPTEASISDGNGHMNSVMTLLPADYDRPASPSDGIIAVSALRHLDGEPDVNYDRGRLRILFRARPDDLASVALRVNGKTERMSPLSRNDLFETYQASIDWNRKTDLTYDFKLLDGTRTEYFGPSGLTDSPGADYKLSAKNYHLFVVPSWVEKSVIYQIFPDRFADGDKSNDPPNVQPWGARPTYSNFFGGDVAGVRDHLGYLSGLGIGAVYFNPVFESPSNHRYETTDYLKIDPKIGTNQEFCDLTRAMKARGIRTVMDFALNHTAPSFFAFKDILEKGQDSAYKNWYFIKSYPVTVRRDPPYVAWANYPSMPKLNVQNPATHQYVLNLVDYWKKHADLSGLRLDAANEVDPQMWRDLRTHLKSYAPDTWIVGEEWGDATPWLKGDQWDSTMGYQFRDAALHFFADGTLTPSQFMDRLMDVYASYPPQVSRNLMNLLDSHDTERFLNSCHGNRDLQLLAATVEFTWPGAPTIYYGDELGMAGGRDPDDRRCMEWNLDTLANPTLQYYRRLIKLRDETPALQSGDPSVLTVSDTDRTIVYSRTLGKQCAVVALNASDRNQQLYVPLPSALLNASRSKGVIDALTGRRYAASRNLAINLPPLKAAVFVPAEASTLSSFSTGAFKAVARNVNNGHRSPSLSQGAHL